MTSPSLPTTADSAVLTVSQLNQAVARVLERSFPLAWVSGEISNFTRAASGHWYFTLKDAQAQVRAVMFRGRAQAVDFAPREGDKVEVRALVSLYAPRGDFQLNVEQMRRAGVGNLYEAFVRLKARLADEGLFEASRKRSLPVFARTIGIVTSPQAAALRDVLTALRRRAPHVSLVLYPTPVQGEGAAEKIAAAIETASRRGDCELLLVCRGGGSLEDLWSFNEEVVARAIVQSRLPVIVGVGHETDVTIADFVADLRAPTPTAAAELAARPTDEWFGELAGYADEITLGLRRQLDQRAQSLDWLARRLPSPSALIRHQQLRIANLQTRLRHASQTPLAASAFRLAQLQQRLRGAMPDTRIARARLAQQSTQLATAARTRITASHHSLQTLQGKLELLAPQRTLERGYAILRDEQGSVLRTPAALRPAQTLHVMLAGGQARLTVGEVRAEPEAGP